MMKGKCMFVARLALCLLTVAVHARMTQDEFLRDLCMHDRAKVAAAAEHFVAGGEKSVLPVLRWIEIQASKAEEQNKQAGLWRLDGDGYRAQQLEQQVAFLDECATRGFHVLAAIGSPVVPRILNLLSDRSFRYRPQLIRSLGEIGSSEVVKPLVEILTEPEVATQEAAAQALAMVGEPAVAAVQAQWPEFNPVVRYHLIRAWGEVRVSGVESILHQAVVSNHRMVRRGAAEALRVYPGPVTVDLLIGALEDTDAVARWLAAESLGVIGDVKALKSLMSVAEDGDAFVRRFAIVSLGKLGEIAAVPVLQHALTDTDPEVRIAAVEAFRQLDPESAISSIAPLLEDEDRAVRRSAARALAEIGGDLAVARLLAGLRSGNRTLRADIAGALAYSRDAGVVEPLIRVLEGERTLASRFCSVVLWFLKVLRSTEPVFTALLRGDEVLRRNAEQSLRSVTGEDLGSSPKAWRSWWRQR